jgi:hypothetical protein
MFLNARANLGEFLSNKNFPAIFSFGCPDKQLQCCNEGRISSDKCVPPNIPIHSNFPVKLTCLRTSALGSAYVVLKFLHLDFPIVCNTMKKIKFLFAGMVLLIFAAPVMAQPVHTPPVAVGSLVVTGLTAEGNCFCTPTSDIFKRKKKHKAKLFAAGAVIGNPVGFGGRVIFRPSRLAAAGDIAYNRIRTDRGILTHAMVLKADARFYSDGFIAKLLRPYVFGGMTMQRGNFSEVKAESVFAADAGIGGGIKLWRLEINGEIGILVPVKQVETYKPGLGAFANIGIMFWLL